MHIWVFISGKKNNIDADEYLTNGKRLSVHYRVMVHAEGCQAREKRKSRPRQ